MQKTFIYFCLLLLISCNSGTDTKTQSTSSLDEKETTFNLNANEIVLSRTESLAGGTNIYDDKYQIGRGFNSSTNEVLAPAVVYNDSSDLTTVSQTEGIFTDVDVKRVTTYDQLKSFMNLNISGNAKYGWLKVSAKVEKFKQVEWNSYSDFLAAKVIVYNPSKILKKAILGTAALKRLKNNAQDFLDFYGDQYISGIKTGGELYVLYQFNSFNSKEKDSTSAAINVAVSAFTGSAKTLVNLKQSLSTLTDKKNLSVRIIRVGDDDSVNVKDPDALLNYIEKFPKIVNSKGNKAALI